MEYLVCHFRNSYKISSKRKQENKDWLKTYWKRDWQGKKKKWFLMFQRKMKVEISYYIWSLYRVIEIRKDSFLSQKSKFLLYSVFIFIIIYISQ